eukprot:1141188-Pelagomonas_calceolata.AAC.5
MACPLGRNSSTLNCSFVKILPSAMPHLAWHLGPQCTAMLLGHCRRSGVGPEGLGNKQFESFGKPGHSGCRCESGAMQEEQH